MKARQKEFVKKIALERIWRLMELAEKEFSKKPERSQRYIDLMNKVAQKNRVRIPRELKLKFCRKCHAFLKKGKNVSLEKKPPFLILTCQECNYSRKMSLKPKA